MERRIRIWSGLETQAHDETNAAGNAALVHDVAVTRTNGADRTITGNKLQEDCGITLGTARRLETSINGDEEPQRRTVDAGRTADGAANPTSRGAKSPADPADEAKEADTASKGSTGGGNSERPWRPWSSDTDTARVDGYWQ